MVPGCPKLPRGMIEVEWICAFLVARSANDGSLCRTSLEGVDYRGLKHRRRKRTGERGQREKKERCRVRKVVQEWRQQVPEGFPGWPVESSRVVRS